MEAPPRTREIAKALRRKMSLPEVLLWKALKGRRLEDLQFRKQHPIGPYILDFYCDAAKLCVEVDGQSHGTEDRPTRDEKRDAWLTACGIATLRLRAGLVLEDMDTTLRMILAAARASKSPSVGFADSSPKGGAPQPKILPQRAARSGGGGAC